MQASVVDFAELQPAGIVPVDASLQQRKSAETRVALLEATIECLALNGYARTSTQLIAQIAKVSRGAMLHHYATRQQLIEAAIDYAFYRHMEKFAAAVAELGEQERTVDNSGIDIDWQLYLSREHAAYVELMVAARTDPELRAVFLPKARRHDKVWRDQLLRIFPEWSGDMIRLARSRRLVQSVMSGMLLNRDVWQDEAMESSILQMLSTILINVRSGVIVWPDKPVASK